MKKPLLVILLSVFMWGVGLAQPRASFNFKISLVGCSGVPAKVTFINTSTNADNFTWIFGDGSSAANVENPAHIYSQPGVYLVILIAANSVTSEADTIEQAFAISSFSLNYSKQEITPIGCDKVAELFTTNPKGLDDGDSLSYSWRVFHNDRANSSKTSTSPSLQDTFLAPQGGSAYLDVQSKFGLSCFVRDTFQLTTASPILPSNGERNLTANRQCTTDDGWVNYYFNNNTPNDETDDSLVLSLKPNGNNIGTIGDGTFSVSTIATPGAGSNTGILLTNPLISNQSGFWVMNRYWNVMPTHQPVTSVGVRFYFNNQDVADVNGSYPSHNLDIRKLIFYKTHGGNPDPTTNLEGAQYITSLAYNYDLADTTHWKDYDDYLINRLDKHVAEFQVSSFSGGGGGATGNGQVLPVQLTSFTATNNGNKVNLQWTTAQEINVSKYNVQVSADGRQFTTLGTVAAYGKTSPDTYAFSYEETRLSKAYYRLQIIEKNGTQTSSNIVPLLFNRVNNNVTLYPNPAKNSVQVKAAMFENKWATADIYNSSGTKVSSAKLYFAAGVANLNTSALASGHYTIVLRNEQSVTHIPLVIVK